MRVELLKSRRQVPPTSTALTSAEASVQIVKGDKLPAAELNQLSSSTSLQDTSLLDERARKIEARKERNRQSAEASRKRVRDQMENLENMNAILQDQVTYLKQRLAFYEAEDGENSGTLKKRRTPGTISKSKNFNTSCVSKLSSLEPAVFIEQPFRRVVLAGA